jgi:hypothetical protein
MEQQAEANGIGEQDSTSPPNSASPPGHSPVAGNSTPVHTLPVRPAPGNMSRWDFMRSVDHGAPDKSETQEAGYHPQNPEERPVPRFPPRSTSGPSGSHNYDGNRAAYDGSRVFYAAILPPVPMIEDIGNHAEYVAWLDKLQSTLRYHQLHYVVAERANRPHQAVPARRWDQDRLRAALIIKGAMGYRAFEAVSKHGWEDTEDPTGTLAKIKVAHRAMCSCSLPQTVTLLDF